MTEIKDVNPYDWYQNLPKKDKSKFLDYMHSHYNVRPNTLIKKMSENTAYQLTKMEYSVIVETITNGLWKD